MTVVIADDSAAIVDVLRPMIDALPGVRVVAAAGDGAATVTAVREHSPDVLVLDLRMPRGNGFAVLAALADHDARPKVLMLTNTPASTFRQRALAAGAAGFFDKSREVGALLDEIRRHATQLRQIG